jgi:CDGSH-type Zn-finger protein
MEGFEMSTEITASANGPYLVHGELNLKDSSGQPYDLGDKTKIALCRCGHSENKPFCDGTHKKIGFQSVVSAPTKVG